MVVGVSCSKKRFAAACHTCMICCVNTHDLMLHNRFFALSG
jgi:hypothetical protein